MRRRFQYVIALRLSRQEWRVLREACRLRGIEPEAAVREALGLPPWRASEDAPLRRERHLRLVRR